MTITLNKALDRGTTQKHISVISATICQSVNCKQTGYRYLVHSLPKLHYTTTHSGVECQHLGIQLPSLRHCCDVATKIQI